MSSRPKVQRRLSHLSVYIFTMTRVIGNRQNQALSTHICTKTSSVLVSQYIRTIYTMNRTNQSSPHLVLQRRASCLFCLGDQDRRIDVSERLLKRKPTCDGYTSCMSKYPTAVQ